MMDFVNESESSEESEDLMMGFDESESTEEFSLEESPSEESEDLMMGFDEGSEGS